MKYFSFFGNKACVPEVDILWYINKWQTNIKLFTIYKRNELVGTRSQIGYTHPDQP